MPQRLHAAEVLPHGHVESSLCQDAPPLPDDDLITVSDVLLVMDQAGSGQLTAAMLEVPPTPDSRAEPWAVAAAAAAAVNI